MARAGMPMTEQSHGALRRSHEILVGNLDVKPAADRLYARSLLSAENHQKILNTTNQFEQRRLFLEILPLGGQAAFDEFSRFLAESQSWLQKSLTTNLREGGPMTEQSHSALRRSHEILVGNLDVKPAADRLYARSLLSAENHQKILNTTNQFEQRRLFLEILPLGGQAAFDEFYCFLADSESQSWLKECLTTNLREASNEPEPFFKLPPRLDEHCIGRENILKEMKAVFDEPGFKIILLHGERNFGKKEIALQFAESEREQYNCIFFVNCIEEDIMMAELQAISDDLNLCKMPTDMSTSILKLGEHLRRRQRFLIILADCHQEFFNPLKVFLKSVLQSQRGKIIFTSSSGALFKVLKYELIEVKGLKEEECNSLIGKSLSSAQYKEGDFEKLYKLSTGSPSILKRVLNHIASSRKTVAEFLSTLPLEGPFNPDELDRRIFAKLRENPLRAIVFSICCLVSPHTPLRLDVFKQGLDPRAIQAIKDETVTNCPHLEKLMVFADLLAKSTEDQSRSHVKDVLQLPISYHLLTIMGSENEEVEIQMLQQYKYLRFVQDECCTGSNECDCRLFTQKIACLCILAAICKSKNSADLNLAKHLKAVLNHGTDSDDSIFRYSSSLDICYKAQLARHYVGEGRFKSAAKLLTDSDDHNACSSPPNLPVACLTWLGRTHLWLGNFQQAISLLEKAKAVVNKWPVKRAILLTHLGSAKAEAGQIEEAEHDLNEARTALDDCSEDDWFSWNLDAENSLPPLVPTSETPAANLLSRFAKLKRIEMFHRQAGPLPQRHDLKRVIKTSIRNFEMAARLYAETNRCQELIMRMYSEDQKVHLLKECQVDSDDENRIKRCEEIVRELEELLPPKHRHIGWAKEKIGWIRSRTVPNENERALTELREGQAITVNVYGVGHRKVANSYVLEASILELLGKEQDALLCLRSAKFFLEEKSSPADEPKLILIDEHLQRLRPKRRRLVTYQLDFQDILPSENVW